MSNKQVFDLDEMLGEARPIVVKIGGAEYGLKRPESMSAIEQVKVSRLQARIRAAQVNASADEQTEADLIDDLTTRALQVLCPELPLDTLPYGTKAKILDFYSLALQGDGDPNQRPAQD